MIRKLVKNLVYRIRGEYTVEQLVKLGLKVGENFNPQVGFELDPSHCWLITIGDNVTFGPHVHILAHDASTYQYLGYTKVGKVSIGNNVFIGDGTIVLPSVSIGNNVVIGAGSVVTSDIPDNTVAVGVPCTVIGGIDDFIEKNRNLLSTSPKYGEEYTLRGKITPERKRQMEEELLSRGGFVK